MSIFDAFAKISSESSARGKIEYIIAGLGNFGLQYENTRHNAGFIAVDKIAENLGVKIDKVKFRGVCADVNINNKRCLLLKPSTYMNNSGESIVQALNFYKLDTSSLIVIYDDISLEPSKIRIRRKGTHGGHNGIRNIIDLTGSEEFLRIKIGVGKKPHPDYDLVKWVLGKFSPEDMQKIQTAVNNTDEAIRLLVDNKIDEAMNKFN